MHRTEFSSLGPWVQGLVLGVLCVALGLPLTATAQPAVDATVLREILRIGERDAQRERAVIAELILDNKAVAAKVAYESGQWREALEAGSETCERDRPIGCVYLGKVLAEGRVGAPDPQGAEAAHRKAAALYAQRCSANPTSLDACEQATDLMNIHAVAAVKDAQLARTYATRARDLATRSCERSGYQCFSAARMWMGTWTGRPDPAAAMRLWRLSCDNDDSSDQAASCNQLVEQLLTGAPEVRDPTEARRRLLADQCAAADPSRRERRTALPKYCASLGELMLDGAGGQVEAARGEQLLRYACGNRLASACTALDTRGLGNDDLKNARVMSDMGDLGGARQLLETRCAANVAVACVEAASLWNRDRSANTEKARRLNARACTLGDLNGCLQSGRNLRRLGGAENLQAARAALAKTCEAKDAEGCGLYGLMLTLGEGGPVDRAAGMQAYEIGCSGRHAASCSNLGHNLFNGAGVAADPVRARGLLEQGCELGMMNACATFGFALAKGRGGPVDVARARGYYQRACDGNNGTGCNNLAYQLREGLGGAADLAASRKAYEKGCNLGDASACNGYSESLLSSAGGPPDLKKAVNMRQFSCLRLNNQPACQWLADGGHSDPLYEGAVLVQANKIDQGVAAFQRACNAGSSKGCLHAGSYLRVPEGDAMKARERREWLGKACDMGERSACDWLRSNPARGLQ